MRHAICRCSGRSWHIAELRDYGGPLPQWKRLFFGIDAVSWHQDMEAGRCCSAQASDCCSVHKCSSNVAACTGACVSCGVAEVPRLGLATPFKGGTVQDVALQVRGVCPAANVLFHSQQQSRCTIPSAAGIVGPCLHPAGSWPLLNKKTLVPISAVKLPMHP